MSAFAPPEHRHLKTALGLTSDIVTIAHVAALTDICLGFAGLFVPWYVLLAPIQAVNILGQAPEPSPRIFYAEDIFFLFLARNAAIGIVAWPLVALAWWAA